MLFWYWLATLSAAFFSISLSADDVTELLSTPRLPRLLIVFPIVLLSADEIDRSMFDWYAEGRLPCARLPYVLPAFASALFAVLFAPVYMPERLPSLPDVSSERELNLSAAFVMALFALATLPLYCLVRSLRPFVRLLAMP